MYDILYNTKFAWATYLSEVSVLYSSHAIWLPRFMENYHIMKNQNSIQEGIKCRLKAGNSCYYSVQTLMSVRHLPKNLKIKIYKTIILPVLLNGCETWSLTLREESRLRVFEKRIKGGMQAKGI